MSIPLGAETPGAPDHPTSSTSPIATVLAFPLDEADLLGRVALGDHDAFARLYDATSARVHGLVIRVLRDPAQAEEVTQEVYLEVWRAASRFDSERGSARAWLATMAHRRAVDRVRTSETSRRRDSRHHDLVGPVSHDAADRPFEATVAAADARAVRDALDLLSPLQRESIELAYFGGHTYAEVADLLGVGTPAVKSRIRDGMLRMRGALACVG